MADNTCLLLQAKHWAYGSIDPTILISENLVPYIIRLFSSDGYGNRFNIYYGDEIDLQFWGMLDLDFGSPDGSPVFTLQSGYLYVYDHTSHKATYYDNNGNVIFEKDNINSVADLQIDFTIHKSHQFEIHIGENAEFRPWYLCARLVKKLYGQSPVINYHKITWEPPYPAPFALISSHDRLYEAKANYHRKVYRTPKLKGAISAINPDLEFSGIAGQVYTDDFIPFKVIRKPMYFTFRSFIPKMLLPWMSMSIYPAIQPTLRLGETQNNRPIYEPWLIQLFKLMFSHPVEPNDDDWPVNVLDLSPNFSY